MRPCKRITVLAYDLTLGSPAQQLLDRFLIGFPRDGEFQPSPFQVTAWLAQPSQPELIAQRCQDYQLKVAHSLAEALDQADAVMIAGPATSLAPPASLLRTAVQATAQGTPLFVHGLLAVSPQEAASLIDAARNRRCPLLSGTALSCTFRLPEVDVPARTRLREALIVVQGELGAAELDALEGLLPVIERRKGSETGVKRLRLLEGDALWRAGESGEWSRALLQAAISRSHTPQGHPVLDGRTEDLVGLGLTPKLARAPRGWLLEHRDTLRSALLVLDGVVADISFAVRTGRGEIISAQLFRPPAPPQEQYSRLAAVLADFFGGGPAPWAVRRSLMESRVLAAMTAGRARPGEWVELASD